MTAPLRTGSSIQLDAPTSSIAREDDLPIAGHTERMEIDSYEEVGAYLNDAALMMVDDAVRSEPSPAVTQAGGPSIGDNVVAHSHERHREESTVAAPAQPSSSRREIDLNAYHDGPLRASLARTVALQRRREALARARERAGSSNTAGHAQPNVSYTSHPMNVRPEPVFASLY